MTSEKIEVEGAGVLTAMQLREFREAGLLRLRGAISDDDVKRMRDHLWSGLARHNRIDRDDRASWPAGIIRNLQPIERDQAFAAMGSATVCAALDTLFGPAGWQHPSQWGELLITFPTPGAEWNVPHQVWHFDVIADSLGPILIMFALLDTVLPGGGGTPVVAGSHRLLHQLAGERSSRISSAQARKLLARSDPWIADLWSSDNAAERVQRYMEQGVEVHGVRLRVAELCGDPGDVFLMHPHILHSVAVNSRAKPRLVLKQCIFGATSPG
jgi:hypothetical protein